MLEVKNLSVTYGQHPALNDVAINVAPGEVVVILGANGAGKSTLLRAISGICEGDVTGDVSLRGKSLRDLSSDQIVEQGVALVPEGRGIFGDLTVKENLLLGAYPARARAQEKANLDRVLHLFPKLQDRQAQIARTMSGGEQQMVAIGRAMMSEPEILMLDEPSLGLSPLLCKELFHNLSHVKDLGIGVLLVEQNAKQSLAIADRGYLLENTKITHEDSASRLMNDPAVQKAYLGAAGSSTEEPAAKSQDISTAHPKAITITPPPRQSAEQHIGGSIDALVSAASKTSATATRAPSVETKTTADRIAQSRIEVVLKDIETAAQSARRKRNTTARQPTVSASAPSTTTDGPVPIIEVYKRPRVEVYRRRPSGKFERD